jgi:lipoprotein-anchoring transpeptidase ErfK/SrfK
MSALRKLAVCYLVSVSAFGLAAGLRAWPGAADEAVRLLDEKIARPAAEALASAFPDAPDSNARVVLALSAPRDPLPPAGPADGHTTDERTLAHADLPRIERPALIDGVAPQVQLTLDAPVLIAPDLPAMPIAPQTQSRAAPVKPAPKMAEAPRLPATPLTPEQTRARFHLAATLTPEMLDNFGLFIFVSKSASGPLAQRMYVFRKTGGALNLLYDWAASTGREKTEVNARGGRSFTATPAGIYQFDPDRIYRQYHSTSWDQDMPHAMFFNWQREGIQTGLAIHAATGDDVARLGARASAGCVHLSPENAATLFNLVKSEYRGQVPRFYINADETMSAAGKFSHRADGSLRMADGYRVLIDIEDYSGADGSDAVALF